MDKKKIFDELKKNSKNIRFDRLCNIVEMFGFYFKGGKGSHRIYVRKGIQEMLNFQNVGGKAKPYQVRQLIKVIKKYNLLEEGNKDV
ncbi:MAG: type II toxin-antitoxin system HicA family toxin [Candidatus Thermoplasmatota archaeon]|nr:type II toxin-antitoxin system HicA family toxin [Candidatus Thermoplasmatota archaeon]MBU4255978.1 type II toxin-antitoxin system HicA family toxin [Candidatus Thermoplasmatota archaeon]